MQTLQFPLQQRIYNQQLLQQLFTEIEMTQSSEVDLNEGGPWFESYAEAKNE